MNSYNGITSDMVGKYIVATVDNNTIKELSLIPSNDVVIDGKIVGIDDFKDSINEDTLFIINGEWTTVDDVDNDSVCTAIEGHGDTFYKHIRPTHRPDCRDSRNLPVRQRYHTVFQKRTCRYTLDY